MQREMSTKTELRMWIIYYLSHWGKHPFFT